MGTICHRWLHGGHAKDKQSNNHLYYWSFSGPKYCVIGSIYSYFFFCLGSKSFPFSFQRLKQFKHSIENTTRTCNSSTTINRYEK